jgi:hypothetical protein
MAFGWRRSRDHLDDEQVLTQYGNVRRPKGGPPFRKLPREKDQGGISMIAGRVAPGDAHRYVGLQAPREGDGVRWTTVGILRKAGFRVQRKPSAANPNHVRITPAGETVWTERHAEFFDGCFTEEPQWLAGGGTAA